MRYILLLLASVWLCSAQDPSPGTEGFISGPSLGGEAVLPDGRRVVFTGTAPGGIIGDVTGDDTDVVGAAGGEAANLVDLNPVAAGGAMPTTSTTFRATVNVSGTPGVDTAAMAQAGANLLAALMGGTSGGNVATGGPTLGTGLGIDASIPEIHRISGEDANVPTVDTFDAGATVGVAGGPGVSGTFTAAGGATMGAGVGGDAPMSGPHLVTDGGVVFGGAATGVDGGVVSGGAATGVDSGAVFGGTATGVDADRAAVTGDAGTIGIPAVGDVGAAGGLEFGAAASGVATAHVGVTADDATIGVSAAGDATVGGDVFGDIARAADVVFGRPAVGDEVAAGTATADVVPAAIVDTGVSVDATPTELDSTGTAAAASVDDPIVIGGTVSAAGPVVDIGPTVNLLDKPITGDMAGHVDMGGRTEFTASGVSGVLPAGDLSMTSGMTAETGANILSSLMGGPTMTGGVATDMSGALPAGGPIVSVGGPTLDIGGAAGVSGSFPGTAFTTGMTSETGANILSSLMGGPTMTGGVATDMSGALPAGGPIVSVGGPTLDIGGAAGVSGSFPGTAFTTGMTSETGANILSSLMGGPTMTEGVATDMSGSLPAGGPIVSVGGPTLDIGGAAGVSGSFPGTAFTSGMTAETGANVLSSLMGGPTVTGGGVVGGTVFTPVGPSTVADGGGVAGSTVSEAAVFNPFAFGPSEGRISVAGSFVSGGDAGVGGFVAGPTVVSSGGSAAGSFVRGGDGGVAGGFLTGPTVVSSGGSAAGSFVGGGDGGVAGSLFTGGVDSRPGFTFVSGGGGDSGSFTGGTGTSTTVIGAGTEAAPQAFIGGGASFGDSSTVDFSTGSHFVSNLNVGLAFQDTDFTVFCHQFECNYPACYVPLPGDCKSYVVCQRTSMGTYVATRMRCAFGSYWTVANISTCERVEDLQAKGYTCPNDPCRDTRLEVYPEEDTLNCRSYWRCHRGVSKPHCCPQGQMFDSQLLTCVDDPMEICRAPCPLKQYGCSESGVRTQPFYDGNCRTYWDCENGHPHPLCCAPGFGYDSSTGECLVNDNCRNDCPPEYLTDVCGKITATGPVLAYSLFDGNCRTFMKCNPKGYDEAFCCRQHFYYNSENQRCEPVQAVQDPCYMTTCPGGYTEECRFSKIAGKPMAYMDVDAGLERPCANGTVEFDETICTCRGSVVPMQRCKPEVAATFDHIDKAWEVHNYGDGHISTIRELKKSITAKGLTYGTFDGSNGMEVWRYGSTTFPEVTLKITFQPVASGDAKQILASNCHSITNAGPSFEVSLDPMTSQITFTGQTKTQAAGTSLQYNKKSWNTFTLLFDGQDVLALIEDPANPGKADSSSTKLSGEILAGRGSLRFGPCNDENSAPMTNGFTGFLSEVRFSKCMDRDNIAFMQEVLRNQQQQP